MNNNINNLIKEFNNKKLGIAYLYPRKHKVRFNGHTMLTEKEAIVFIKKRLSEPKIDWWEKYQYKKGGE